MILVYLRSYNITIVWFWLSEGEEEGQATAKEGDYSHCHCEYQVHLLALKLSDYHLEGEIRHALEDISDWKRLSRVVELKANHFLGVRVDGAVSESPEEAHDPCHVVELVHDYVPDGRGYHEHDAH